MLLSFLEDEERRVYSTMSYVLRIHMSMYKMGEWSTSNFHFSCPAAASCCCLSGCYEEWKPGKSDGGDEEEGVWLVLPSMESIPSSCLCLRSSLSPACGQGQPGSNDSHIPTRHMTLTNSECLNPHIYSDSDSVLYIVHVKCTCTLERD